MQQYPQITVEHESDLFTVVASLTASTEVIVKKKVFLSTLCNLKVKDDISVIICCENFVGVEIKYRSHCTNKLKKLKRHGASTRTMWCYIHECIDTLDSDCVVDRIPCNIIVLGMLEVELAFQSADVVACNKEREVLLANDWYNDIVRITRAEMQATALAFSCRGARVGFGGKEDGEGTTLAWLYYLMQ